MRFSKSLRANFYLASGFAIALFSSSPVHSQTREEKVLGDKLKFESNGLWYYNDLTSAFETAKKTNQPLLVVLRCIPCEECVKLDDDLLESDPQLQRLLKSFVRVRIVGTNGLDLSLFEFDTDQSFAVFFFNADRTLYGRYGTRSDRTAWESDVSVQGLGKALESVLQLHRGYPANREMLVGKQANQPLFATPEKIPSLASKYTGKIDYQGNVVKSCIHCHQIGDAMREHYRTDQGKLPEEWLFPYPHPKSIGLILDPKECATVLQVVKNSPADASGFQVGDKIESLQSQSIISLADVQWVLHHVSSDSGTVNAIVRRGEQSVPLSIALSNGWRTKEDLSWRVSSWPLRQKGLGGMLLKPSTDEERSSLGIDATQMALTVQHVGMFAPHDRAKKAGVEKGDVLIEYDGRRDFLRETDLLAHAINKIKTGQSVPMQFRRGEEVRKAAITTAP
ncbi:MAG: Trx7/PDZ domain-containing (seleno)protein [Pirellulaceae bacterium]|nr:Trx7/PDZ domain-containing (seleno)protein [Pirellulaceae bacterium]